MSTITCSAPGSIIFMGEYAALAGYPGVVGAISQRSTVSITPIDEPILDVYSEIYGSCKIELGNLSAPPAYQYTLSSFKQFLPVLQHQGFQIYFHPDVSSDKLLGTSGAITVGLCSAFYHYIHGHLNLKDICTLACQAVSTIQRHSSCADVVASTYGGIIRYTMATTDQPNHIQQVYSDLFPFAVYSGYVTSETITAHRGIMREKKDPALYNKIHAEMGALSDTFFEKIKSGCSEEELGKLLLLGGDLLEAYELQTKEITLVLHKTLLLRRMQ